jgi:hypothetical protein
MKRLTSALVFTLLIALILIKACNAIEGAQPCPYSQPNLVMAEDGSIVSLSYYENLIEEEK